MSDFSLWDIIRNLLLAGRWTVLLSLIAFVCGGLVGIAILMMRTSSARPLRQFAVMYIELFQGKIGRAHV